MAPEAMIIMLFGPGVIVEENAKRYTGTNKSTSYSLYIGQAIYFYPVSVLSYLRESTDVVTDTNSTF